MGNEERANRLTKSGSLFLMNHEVLLLRMSLIPEKFGDYWAFSICGLFPLDGACGLWRQVIENAVDARNFMRDAVGDVL